MGRFFGFSHLSPSFFLSSCQAITPSLGRFFIFGEQFGLLVQLVEPFLSVTFFDVLFFLHDLRKFQFRFHASRFFSFKSRDGRGGRFKRVIVGPAEQCDFGATMLELFFYAGQLFLESHHIFARFFGCLVQLLFQRFSFCFQLFDFPGRLALPLSLFSRTAG